MRKYFLCIFVVFVPLFALAAESPEPSLEAPPTAGACKSVSDLTSGAMPPEIYVYLKECIDDKNYKNAAELFTIAHVYGRFDAKRTQKPTKFELMDVNSDLQESLLNSMRKKEKAEFMAVLDARTKRGSEGFASICSALVQGGAPIYTPTYAGSEPLLISDFDATAEWTSVSFPA